MEKKHQLGVSFSLHRCSELGLDKKQLLEDAITDLGFRRFRLMSYWNIHEPVQGKFNFDELDWQMDMVAKYGGKVTLCLGKRQPRWPECHMPKWAHSLSNPEWYEALYKYIEVVVKRYKDHPALDSWQLENEALLREFGCCIDQDYSHHRLQKEYEIVKNLDNNHPVIMTLSDSWGIPWKNPHPEAYAISLYIYTINKHGKYNKSIRLPLFYKIRAAFIKLLRQKPVFIHELQAEPWLTTGITNVSVKVQLEQFGPEEIKNNIIFAKKTGLYPIDLWGLEWWYWLKTRRNHPEYWNTIKTIMIES